MKPQHIIDVLPYNFNWSKQFELEAESLKKIFAKNFIAVFHIGSTAIPNMWAKPTIDIMLEVKDINLDAIAGFMLAMTKLGYTALGENGISGRRFFLKGIDKRTHHLHVFQTGSKHIIRHICFRDYLITHSQDAQEYSQLKIKLAKKFFNNRLAYCKNKQQYIKKLELKALKFFAQQ